MKNALHRQTDRQTDRQTERNSAIELLRILAGMAIVVLHFNFFNLHVVEQTTGMTQKTLLMLEAICGCAVNVFILISGYCNVNSRKIKTGKLINLVLQTSIFSFIFTLLVSAIHNSWSIKRLSASLLPVNYYVILYVSLMLVAPFINLLIDKLSRENMKKFLYISLTVFSIYPTMIDVLEECLGKRLGGLSSISGYGSMAGYTIVNFILVYLVGACVRKLKMVDKVKIINLITMLVLLMLGIFIWYELLPKTAYNYCNPLVISEACVVFMIFAKMNFRNMVINTIAPASFTCYLIHGYFLDMVQKTITIENDFFFIIGLLLGCVVGIYLISVLVMNVWIFVDNILFYKLREKIPCIEVHRKQ